jgi:tetratricopeptide (TPR) repeat protein
MTKKSSTVCKTVKRSAGKTKAKSAKTVVKLSNKQLNEMLSQARDFAWAGQHTKTIEICTQALDAIGKGNSRTIQIQMDLLNTRSESNFILLLNDAMQKDAKLMMQIANTAPSSPKKRKFALKARALIWKALEQNRQNNIEQSIKTLANALKTARLSKQKDLEAESLFWLGIYDQSIQPLQKSVDLFLSLGNKPRESLALALLAFQYKIVGKIEEARDAAQTALTISNQIGYNVGKGQALSILAQMEFDLGRSLNLDKQSYQSFKAAGHLVGLTSITNNLGYSYSQLGLYPRALRFYQKSLDGFPGRGYPLSNIAHVEIELNTLDLARKHVAELRSLQNDRNITAFTEELNGRIKLSEGNPKAAIRYIKKAIRISQKAELTREIGEFALLGQAYLADRNPTAALKATTRAVNKHRKLEFPIVDDHPSQNIWWRHMQAQHANKKYKESDKALEMAYDFLLKGIENTRDDGLRRNYLNKVRINREIIQAWDKHAAKRKLPKERRFAHLEVETSLREPFERLAEISLELNALHTLERIQTFLVEEATELIGGERVMLILENQQTSEVSRSASEVSRTVVESILPLPSVTKKPRIRRMCSNASENIWIKSASPALCS